MPYTAMHEIVYRNYKIVATAEKTEAGWRPLAYISPGCGRRTILLKGEKLFDGKRQAEDYALRLGKHRMNNRLQKKQRSPQLDKNR